MTQADTPVFRRVAAGEHCTLGFERFRFSSEMLPDRDRRAIVRDVLSPQIGMDIDHARDLPFKAQFDFLTLPGARIYKGTSAASGARTPRRLADGDDSVVLTIALEAGFFIGQGGTDTFVAPGNAMLVDWRAPFTVSDVVPSKSISVLLPHRTMSTAVPGLDAACGRLLPSDGATALLAGYMNAMLDTPLLDDGLLADLAGRHIRDLAALAIDASAAAAALTASSSVRAARMAAIKSFIAAHLGRHDLTLDKVARRHALTRRYLQRLFEAEGSTFSAFVLEQRLCRARALLRDPKASGAPIGLIAYQCGFREISYFNRAFRIRFGGTPSDVRTDIVRTGQAGRQGTGI